jgi:putative transposase
VRKINRVEKKGPALIYLTTPTRDLMPIFRLENLARQAVLQFGRAAIEAEGEIFGYVLLPSALYALVGFQGTYDLPSFMHNFKWLSSRAIVAQEHGEFHERLYRKDKFKPWMNRFDNLAISTKAQFEAKLEYLHNEPVRKGLVNNPADWEFSSARDWIKGEPGLIGVSRDWTRYWPA